MPGFVDMHVHAGGAPKNAEAEYAYKLWLAHGVTTVRGVSLERTTLTEWDTQRENEIVAPRIFNYQRPGGTDSPENAQGGAPERVNLDGLKLARTSRRSWRR